MKPLRIFAVIVTAIFTGCQSSGTPEQQALRGKNVARLESSAWNVASFASRLVEGFLINSAANLARKQGFAK